MNMKWKVALLSLLGFSTVACCGTKKATKSEDKKSQDIVTEEEDPRIMLMYGVPFPDGTVVRPIQDENTPNKGGVPFPDGRVVSPLTEEEAAKRVEEMQKAEAVEVVEETAEE